MKKDRKNQIRDLVLSMWNYDTDAFVRLYSMTCDDIYNFCMCILRDKSMAIQAVTETYSNAYRNILHLTDPNLFEIWLRRIAFQICNDRLMGIGDPAMYSMISPEQLEVLPFHERQIVFLSDYRNLKTSDIASVLNISKREVDICLKNAKLRLMALKENGKF